MSTEIAGLLAFLPAAQRLMIQSEIRYSNRFSNLSWS